MRTQIIPHKDGSFIIANEVEPIEHVWPIQYFEKQSKELFIKLARFRVNPKFHGNPFFEFQLKREANVDWEERLISMKSLNLPPDLYKILTSDKKKEQIKLWKGQSLTSAQFQSFLLRAGEFGYRYSKYRAEFYPEWANKFKIPTIFHMRDDGGMDVVGETNMSNGQLKQLLQQRTVRIIHMLDNGFRWHCLFTTYRNLRGEENYGKGTPHLHYLSNFWQWDRSLVVNGLKSRSHKFTTSVHIPFIRHG